MSIIEKDGQVLDTKISTPALLSFDAIRRQSRRYQCHEFDVMSFQVHVS